MPKRKTLPRASGSVSAHDVQALRDAIAQGYPWVLHQADNLFRHAPLNSRQSICLTYLTGITCGVAVFLAFEPHPAPETVQALKAELQGDIDEAEKRFGGLFTGERHCEDWLRYENPGNTREYF